MLVCITLFFFFLFFFISFTFVEMILAVFFYLKTFFDSLI